ncbi:MAG: TetR/AcrR family transcriptional regulator, partial [Anaerolineae bacterium]|nr:TetR/AcrR family transcriptional regulator [Anaerolineae bacterium]
MARTVNLKNQTLKRKEILDATQKLIFTKGYEQMSIQDVLKEINLSNGAFHHYFPSRNELLTALIDRIRIESGNPLIKLVEDSRLNGLEKLQAFFDTLDQLRLDKLD